MATLRNRAAVVGIGQTPYSRDSGTSETALALQAIGAALHDAAIDPSEVDGLIRYAYDNVSPATVVRNLGIPALRWFGEVPFGGVALCGVVAQAAAAIAAGQARVVVVWRALNERSGVRYGRAERHFQSDGAGTQAVLASGGRTPAGEFSGPWGLLVPGQSFALVASRYAAEAGIAQAQLSQALCRVAVQQRAYAQTNPAAIMRGRTMGADDYFASRMVYDPLRLFDLCLESDGAAALVIAEAGRAQRCRAPVFIRSGFQFLGPHTEPISIFGKDLLAPTPPAFVDRLFSDAQLRREDMDFAQVYDATSYAVLAGLEQYGFVPRLQGWRWLQEHGIGADAPLPVNTHGGHLSEAYIHGMNHMVEAVRQLRGTAANQLPRARHGIVVGGSAGAVILGQP
ncbi:thiolase C-terminal domain-containing protein [Pseudorhodoferax sp.]|uniref:thiolase C-terminal domain-containing protein n=1 Tax=Pseudorhodoferax sp. TaxID=1993553 RepID=UPI002DD66BEA|nr:hypothetical protein [Pseudorhodoferax sp.]